MSDFPELIGKAAESKLAEKAYDDAASPAFKELGKVGADLVKTARLVLAPLQVTATLQDRFELFLERLKARVPEERQVSIPPEISGPALDSMQYLEHESPLLHMFEELLIKAADSENIKLAHPAFVHLIKQLSRDEAYLLSKLRDGDFEIVDTLELNREKNRFENRVVEKSTIPESELFNPHSLGVYYSHLQSLSLVIWPVVKEDAIREGKVQTGTRRHSKMQLTEFGALFVNACIPAGGISPAA